MAEVWFYHLERRSVEQELPSLLQRGLERGLKMAVQVRAEDRLRTLSDKIWSHEDVSFLPHGLNGEGNAAAQPIVLLAEGTPKNGAAYLFCIEGAEPGMQLAFERVTILFDGNDETRVDQARSLWKRFKGEGHSIRYWKQDDEGRWKDQAG